MLEYGVVRELARVFEFVPEEPSKPFRSSLHPYHHTRQALNGATVGPIGGRDEAAIFVELRFDQAASRPRCGLLGSRPRSAWSPDQCNLVAMQPNVLNRRCPSLNDIGRSRSGVGLHITDLG